MFKQPELATVLPTNVNLTSTPQYNADNLVSNIPLYDKDGNIAYLIPGTVQKVINLLHDGRLFTLQGDRYIESDIHVY